MGSCRLVGSAKCKSVRCSGFKVHSTMGKAPGLCRVGGGGDCETRNRRRGAAVGKAEMS